MTTIGLLRPLSPQPLIVGIERTEIRKGPEDFVDLFRRQGAIVCPGLFHPALLERLMRRCRAGQFREDSVEGLGSREVEAPQVVGGVINLLLQRANFLHWVEQATGCGPLATVAGRVVQTRANGSDRLRWHDDLDDHARRLGITINLSDTSYRGGDFELRTKGGNRTAWTFHHDPAGTALIFDIRRDLEHRLTPLISGGPRRVYTGWFLQERA